MGGYLREDIKIIEDVISENNDNYDVIVGYTDCDTTWLEQNSRVNNILNYDVFTGLLNYGEISYVPYLFYKEHEDDIQWVFDNLEDEFSKATLASYINQRISCNYKYSEGYICSRQYFDLDELRLAGDKEEIFVDGGGYDGRDTLNFLNLCRNSFSYIFEPEPASIRLCNDKLKGHEGNYRVIPKGLWCTEEVLYFKSGEESSSLLSNDGNIAVECISIDAVLSRNKVTYIKLDVEGSEIEALEGAKETIIKYHPRLAICIYHKPDDIYRIPRYIRTIDESYRFYIRRYEKSFIETVLYAI